MKPTPNELAILAHEIARVYGTLEEWMIRRIVQRLMDGAPDLPAEVEDWRIEKILASASFRRESVAVMRKVLGDIPPQVDRMLYHTARESVDGGDGATLQEAWERGLVRNMPQPEMAAKTTFMIEKLKEQALDRMNLVNTSMLTSAQQKYINTLNVAAGFMLSGESPHVAMKTATRQLVKDGLTGFYDRAGRQWEPQSAVEMILRTTGNSAANQAAFTRMDEVGCDVIVVSSHLGARPKCSLVQGKLFSRSGTTKTVKDKNGAVWQVGDWNKTSYGEPDGILGINCRHHIGMFFDGLSENKQEQIDETKNRERYEQEQKQRKLERELRKAKRERDVAKEIGDEDGARYANAKVRAKSKELRSHIEEFDLRRSRVRERYYALNPEHLKEKLDFIDPYTNEKGFLPKHAIIDKSLTIAKGSRIRVVDRLVAEYGGDPSHWHKKAGRIMSDKYIHDVHWLELNGEQYEVKLKSRSLRK